MPWNLRVGRGECPPATPCICPCMHFLLQKQWRKEGFKGTSDMPINKWRVTWNYACIPFKYNYIMNKGVYFSFFAPYFCPLPLPGGWVKKNELLMGCWKEMMKKEKGGMCEGIGFLFFNLNDLKLFIRNIYSSFNSSLFS